MARPPVNAKGRRRFLRQLDEALDFVEASGGGGGGGSTSWASITGKPSTFPPETHAHVISDVTGLSGELANIPVRGTFTVTVPNNRFEWAETVAASGVVPADVVLLSVAAHLDSDENDAEMLDITAMSGAAGTNQVTVTLAFATPTAGPIKLNWMAA